MEGPRVPTFKKMTCTGVRVSTATDTRMNVYYETRVTRIYGISVEWCSSAQWGSVSKVLLLITRYGSSQLPCSSRSPTARVIISTWCFDYIAPSIIHDRTYRYIGRQLCIRSYPYHVPHLYGYTLPNHLWRVRSGSASSRNFVSKVRLQESYSCSE